MSEQKKSDFIEHTIITSIEKLDIDADKRAYILFLSGPLQGKLMCLTEGETILGRADDADVPVADSRISRKHCTFTLEDGKATLKDLGSTNGTFVNAKRIDRHVLENGDKIQVSSSTVIKFAYGDKGERMFHDEFYQMANFDAVTNVYNKRFFTERFKEEFSHARRTKTPLSLVMIDIDFFKKVNDTYGHLAGDFILGRVAQTMKSMIRGEDILARYGGEEFALILRGTHAEGAVQLAERIRLAIADKPMSFEDKAIIVTVSLGVATLAIEKSPTPADLIAKADAYLYESKKNGRNRVSAENTTA
ncbi:MAG: GGDEF domain-containing protein [Deltaproteobacteria bacterium]|nr:GGDEF domain-containing protein [Deltaproteobacteria bacterium]